MIEELITSKTRVKLLLKFFLNPNMQGYLRGLAEELGESTNSIRVELKRLTKANYLVSSIEGRTKVYKANQEHPFYKDLLNIIRKFTGIQYIVDHMVSKLEVVDVAYLTGDYAKGIDSGIIELTLVGEIQSDELIPLVNEVEKRIAREIRVITIDTKEYHECLFQDDKRNRLVVWQADHILHH